MRTLITIFATVVMAFALNAPSPAIATEESDRKTKDFFFPPSVGTGCVDPSSGRIMEGTTNCEQYHSHNEIDKLNEFADSEGGDFGESGGGDFADSGDEGSTSAASAGDQ